VTNVRERMGEFRDLEVFDSGEKRRMYSRVRMHAKLLAPLYARLMWGSVVSLYIALLGIVAIFIAAPFITRAWLETRYSSLTWGILILIYALLALLLFAASFYRARRKPEARRLPRGWMYVLGSIGAVVLLLTVFGTSHTDVNVLWFGAAAFSTALVLSVVCVLLVRALQKLWIYRTASVFSRSYPETVVVDGLLGALVRPQIFPAGWHRLDFRRQLALSLERSAVALQDDLPRGLATGDPQSDASLKERGVRMATAVRSRKAMLLRGGAAGRQVFAAAIARLLVLAVDGDWRRFPVEEAPPSERRTRVAVLLEIGLIAVVALAPLVAVALLQQTGSALEGAIRQSATLGVVLWAVFYPILRLDPQLVAKLRAFRDITRSLGGS
jgi:hypothetical protein